MSSAFAGRRPIKGLIAAAFRAYNNLSVVYEAQDRVGEMLTISQQAIDLTRRAGDRG